MSATGNRPLLRRPLLRRPVVNVALVVLGLAAMLWMDRHRPNLTTNQAPFPTRSRLGETVRGRDFALTTERIELARALELGTALDGTPVRRDTDGVWLVVHARVEGLYEPITLPGSVGAPSLRTADGTVYAHAGVRLPFGYPLLTGGSAAPPGIPVRGLLVFELPPSRLAGAVLIASRQILPDLDSTVEIDLGLTPAEARRQLAAMPSSLSIAKGQASW